MPQPGAMPAPMGGAPQRPQVGGRAAEYLAKTAKILPAIVDRNPHYQEQVGQTIFDFICEMAGQDLAPKITGMLIDLPIVQIRNYLQSYEHLQAKVQEAKQHLEQQ
jgi:hypothetical protein